MHVYYILKIIIKNYFVLVASEIAKTSLMKGISSEYMGD